MSEPESAAQTTGSRYWNDSDWAIANAQMLSERYPNQWVAIYNKKVIACGRQLDKVVLLAQQHGANDAVFKFVERGIHVYFNPITI